MTQLLRSASVFLAVFMTLVGLTLAAPAVTSAQGWYLMEPPWHTVIKEGEDEFDPTAPLTKWEQIGAFDTSGICENARLGIVQQLEKGDKERLDRAAESYLRHPSSDPLQTNEGKEYARYSFGALRARASRC